MFVFRHFSSFFPCRRGASRCFRIVLTASLDERRRRDRLFILERRSRRSLKALNFYSSRSIRQSPRANVGFFQFFRRRNGKKSTKRKKRRLFGRFFWKTRKFEL
jgi:hypothetical protein